MLSIIAGLALLVLTSADVRADEPVQVILYGPNPGIDRELEMMTSGAPSLQRFDFVSPKNSIRRKLMASVNGDMTSEEARTIFASTWPDSWLAEMPARWHLSMRSNGRFARVSVGYWHCEPVKTWVLAKQGGEWMIIDDPLWNPCLDFGPTPMVTTHTP